jgi:hypothetical protein
MSATDNSFTLSTAAFQQQALALLKDMQDYGVRVTELAVDHPFIRAARSVPSTHELIDGSFGVVAQTVELQRDFASRLAGVITAK